MKAWILGVALVGATGGGVAFVLASKGDVPACGACPEVKANTGTGTDSQPGDCPSCKPSRMAATDLADVSALLAAADTAGAPRVSFDEPPFAQPARAQQPEVEVAPMPRSLPTVEEAPMPRPAM